MGGNKRDSKRNAGKRPRKSSTEAELQTTSRKEEFQPFSPAQLEERINSLEMGTKNQAVYKGVAVMCDTDVYNSTGLKGMLEMKKYSVPVTFFSDYIKNEVQPIIKKHGGYFDHVMGDNVRSVFGIENLESALRCTTELTRWFDRNFTEYFKDYVAAWVLLKEDGKLREGDSHKDHNRNDQMTKHMINELRKIKDKSGDDIPEDKRKLKERYERWYKEIDDDVAEISSEKRGRIVTKTAIAVDKLVMSASVDQGGRVSISLDGEIRYLLSRLTDKNGPLQGEEGKDHIIVGFFPERQDVDKEIPEGELPNLLEGIRSVEKFNFPSQSALAGKSPTQISKMIERILRVYYKVTDLEKDPPLDIRDVNYLHHHPAVPRLKEYFIFDNPSKAYIGRNTFWVYDSHFIDYFEHPDFNGLLPKKSPMLERLDAYRRRINEKADFLYDLEKSFSDAGGGKLDITKDEAVDRYKNGRTLMTATLAIAILEEIPEVIHDYTKLYERLRDIQSNGKSPKKSRNGNGYAAEIEETGLGYMMDLERDFRIKDLSKGSSKLDPDKLILAALLWNLGGAKVRAWSSDAGVPKYATRLLPKDINDERKKNETRDATTTASQYRRLEELGIPELISYRDKTVSYTYEKGGHMLAVERMIIGLADRYIHNVSERPFRTESLDPVSAIYKIREEMKDIIKPDNSGHTERLYALIEHAFLRVLGFDKKKDVPFEQPPAAYKRC